MEAKPILIRLFQLCQVIISFVSHDTRIAVSTRTIGAAHQLPSETTPPASGVGVVLIHWGFLLRLRMAVRADQDGKVGVSVDLSVHG
jgi:hypothetical protein